MKQFLLFLTAMTFSIVVNGQTPGGVGTANLSGWWDASTLTSGNVTSWTSSWPAGGSAIVLNESGTPYPQAINTPLNATSNYNMTIDFTGNTAAQTMVLENQTNLDLLDQRFSTSEGSFFVAYYLPATQVQAGAHIVNYREATSGTVDGIQMRAKLGTSTGRLAIGTGNSTNASRDWVQDFVPDIVSYWGNRSSATSMHAYERAAEFTGGGGSGTSGSIGLHVGARRSGTATYSGIFDGFISEVIFFDRNLNSTEIGQVHTYLGIKYGISLENSTGDGDYISSNGTIVWDASQNSTYQNEIIGLARDDSSGLMQKQSHHFSDVMRIYMSNLEANNAANTGTFLANNSYVIIGNNQDALCGSSGSGDESPASATAYLSRLSREWKVTKTNFSQPFNLEIELDTCSVPGGLISSDFQLLVDGDGDFSDATAYAAGAGLGISYSGGMVTITGLSDAQLPNDSTSYLTLAYGLPLVTISADSVICGGDSVLLTFSVVGTTSPLDVMLYDGTSLTTYPGVIDGDAITLNPTSTTTYSTLVSGPLHCCLAQDTSSSHTVTIASDPVISANANPSSVCPGDFVLLSGSGAISYTWTGNVNNGTPFVPPASGTYVVTGTDLNGCQDTASIFVEVYTPPTPALGQDTVICTGDTIVLNAGSFSSYLWQDNTTASTFLVSSLVPGINTYSISVTDTNLCQGSDSIVVDISVCIGIEEQAEGAITVFPSPASEGFKIRVNGHFGEMGVRIFDGYGRMVYSGSHSESTIQLNLPEMSSGVYFIEVEGEGVREVVKLLME